VKTATDQNNEGNGLKLLPS